MWQSDHLENTNLTIHQSDKPLSGTELSELGGGGGQSRGEFKITRFAITLMQPVTLFSQGMPIADVFVSLASFTTETDVIASLKTDSCCRVMALRSCCASWYWSIDGSKDRCSYLKINIYTTLRQFGVNVYFFRHSRNFYHHLWRKTPNHRGLNMPECAPSAYTRLLLSWDGLWWRQRVIKSTVRGDREQKKNQKQ